MHRASAPPVKHIPEDKRDQVPVTLQATAGMRILPPEASAEYVAVAPGAHPRTHDAGVGGAKHC